MGSKLPDRKTQPKVHQAIEGDKDWRVFAAQTNTRLLHVLSDLVKAFIDTESEIQSSLSQWGLRDSNDDNNNQSESREDMLSSLEDTLNDKNFAMSSPRPGSCAGGGGGGSGGIPLGEGGDFCDDGPDLITSFLIPSGEGSPDGTTVNIDDDVVLGASRRLRAAVDRILHLLKNVAALQYETSGGRSSADSSVQTVVCPMDDYDCSRCVKRREAINKLQKDLDSSQRMNRVLQEELNTKHLELSALKSRIDNTSILEARSLKERNDELRRLLKEKDLQLTRLKESSELNFSKNFTSSSRQTIETGRDATGSPSIHGYDFSRSKDFLHDDIDSLSPVKLDEVLSDRERKMLEGGDMAKDSDDARSVSSNAEFANLFQKVIEEKNQEIEVLRQQMKLAQEMIATAFPTQTTQHDLLDVDLIEALVESHLRKKSVANTSSGQAGPTGVDLIPDNRGDKPKSPDSAVPSASSDSSSVDSTCVNDSNDTSFMTIEQLDGRLNQLYSVVENLMRTNNRIQDQQQQMQREKDEVDKKYSELSKATQGTRTRIDELETENAKLRESLVKRGQELSDMKRRTDAEKSHQISLLQSSLKVKDEEIESLQERIHSVLRRLDAVTEEDTRRKEHEKKEEDELRGQISQLKTYRQQQRKQILDYETRVQSLLTTIEELKLELDTSSLKDKKIKDLESQLKTANEIISAKKTKVAQLMDTLTKFSQHNNLLAPSTSSIQTKVLVKKLKKSQHEKRSLIFQKNYLTNVLSGFQLTERATLALLSSMNVNIPPDPCQNMSPLRKFRSAVFVVMATQRMKLLVKKWSFKSPKETNVKMIDGSSQSSSSRKLSLSSSASSSSSSSHKQHKERATVDHHRQRTNESMEDFMARLREIHESLGLNHSLSDPISPFD